MKEKGRRTGPRVDGSDIGLCVPELGEEEVSSGRVGAAGISVTVDDEGSVFEREWERRGNVGLTWGWGTRVVG
jgi:hypothetical protein